MTVIDFNDLAARVYELHGRSEYAEALSLTDWTAGEFPDRAATIIFWRACLHALVGDPDTALMDLRAGLDGGHWWAPSTLGEDTDLDAVRALDGFGDVLTESEARWRAEAAHLIDQTIVVEAEHPRATVTVLQGGLGSVEQVVDQWSRAPELDCTLVVPGLGQPTSSDLHHANWIDEDATDRRIRAALDEMDFGTLLIAGYSAGGREALRIGLTGSPVEATGLLLFGPGPLRQPVDASKAASRGLRVWSFVGEDDRLLDDVLATDERLRQTGIEVAETRVPGVGHVVPENLPELLPSALEFLLGPGD
jgi:A/B hydrolase-like, N-terminal domain